MLDFPSRKCNIEAMKTLTRRSFISNAAKVATLAAVPVLADAPRYTLTVTENLSEPARLILPFDGPLIPEFDLATLSENSSLVVMVSGSQDGQDRVFFLNQGRSWDDVCESYSCDPYDWRLFERWPKIHLTKTARGTKVRILGTQIDEFGRNEFEAPHYRQRKG